ncbi:HutD family protein [Microbacterium aurantiacum]|uniref:HutD family protein n=1 Tax=Microbacterium aurantiacum TaxID=162393 RepID=UPI000C7FB4E2|nr:HutD family protein [Microbacterium aurantiacum]
MLRPARTDDDIIRPDAIEPEPWANGLGVTRVMAARSSWRISLAEIQGRMPFSSFLGADRVLIPLSPEGVTLEIDGELRAIPCHTGREFRGEDRVVADTGGGRVMVVNFMSRRSSGRMRWEIHRGSGLTGTGTEAVVVLGGQVCVAAERLPPGTVILSTATSRVAGGRDGVVALLRVEPRRD